MSVGISGFLMPSEKSIEMQEAHCDQHLQEDPSVYTIHFQTLEISALDDHVVQYDTRSHDLLRLLFVPCKSRV
jgi:hypothetical protein